MLSTESVDFTLPNFNNRNAGLLRSDVAMRNAGR
jgi:hypothetical protein